MVSSYHAIQRLRPDLFFVYLVVPRGLAKAEGPASRAHYWTSRISDESKVEIFCLSTIWHARLSIIRLRHGKIKVGSGKQARLFCKNSPIKFESQQNYAMLGSNCWILRICCIPEPTMPSLSNNISDLMCMFEQNTKIRTTRSPHRLMRTVYDVPAAAWKSHHQIRSLTLVAKFFSSAEKPQTLGPLALLLTSHTQTMERKGWMIFELSETHTCVGIIMHAI